MDNSQETVNEDGSITLTSRDGLYSVRYIFNDKGQFVDEWDTGSDIDLESDPWDDF